MRKLPWKTLLVVLVGGAMGLALLCAGLVGPCWSGWIGDGVLLDRCPVGEVRPVALVEADGLGRKDEGRVTVGVTGHYVDEWGGFGTTPVRRFDATLTLVTPDGKELPLEPIDGWDASWGFRHQARVKLPELPDGDYTLRVATGSPAGEAAVEAPLPLYQPALAHVLTDAPLYKPGQEIRFRGVLLGAADLAPLDGRPAVWKVYDPAGELLLEEKVKAGAFGVAAGSFPLAPDAESGAWAVELVSGAASDRVAVEVKPFQLPRFTVDATSPAPAWKVGETPVVAGVVRYTSGAPVGNAPLRVTARSDGAWPPPREWLAERTLVTDTKGGFRFEVGEVPADLRGRATVRFTVTATDPTGDTAVGGASVLLAEDAIAAEAVTELAGGLVPSANNRVYVRVTTPEGRILPGASVRVTREWDPADPGMVAEADADGVARFQLDPGEPITVVVPPMPVRPRPRAAVVAARLTGATDVLTDEPLDLEGQVALDRWTARVRGCADRVVGEARAVEVSALLGSDGRPRMVEALVGGERTPLSRCVASALAGETGPRGRDRLWSLGWEVSDPGAPWVEVDVEGHVGSVEGVAESAEARMVDARRCVAGAKEAAGFPRAWRVAVREGERGVGLTPLADPSLDGRVDAGTAACVERSLAGLSLDEAADADGVGLLRLSLGIPGAEEVEKPEPTTFPGFSLRVEASRGDEKLGQTMLRLPVGAVPDLRLRFSEVIVDPGATVELTAVRGPNFSGSFPEKMWLHQGDRSLVEFPFDTKARKATVKVPDDASGFVHVQHGDARAVLYVRPKADLALALSTDRPTYRPGETAQLTVTARDGEKPVGAGVTLTGVDSTLATLAALPNPDDFARVTVRALSATPAFGVLDARALQTGQIAGQNAAQAAVLRVTTLPSVPPGADRVHVAETRGTFTPDAELTDAFYGLYRHARAQVRAWEEEAPAEELLTAKRMIELWEAALAANPATDPFGRPLHLSVLPTDLLALTDPRFMASDGARLPEDVENWPQFVAAEAP